MLTEIGRASCRERVYIAPQVLSGLRESEPAMIALAKRVNARNGVSAPATEVAASAETRGPRNQPKRKGKKK